MLQLPNNCRAGNFAVYPSNWKTVKASVKIHWRVSYRFFDDNLNQQKRIVIKAGINSYQSAAERRDAVKEIIAFETDLLQVQGYNKITETYAEINDAEISGYTRFLNALEFVFDGLKVEPHTKEDIKSFLKYFSLAAERRGYERYSLKDITKKHLKLTLEECGKVKALTKIPIGKTGRTQQGIWSANQFNHYRKYLSLLYTELVDLDVMDYNPVTYIKKQKTTKKIRETLTREQRTTVNNYLKTYKYSFWRFLQLFFHSGCRITELLQLKHKDVDILNQRFKVTVKKGRSQREAWRTIKTIALPLWQEVCDASKKDQFLFAAGLVPGNKSIRSEQVTRRWKVHIKDRFGITADFYSLKHTNLDEVAAQLGLQAAQEMAGHTTPVITMVYATGESGRKHDRLKEISNTF